MNNITAGVREPEEANRTRVAGHLDEIQGVVPITLNVFPAGAVGFIDWLDFVAMQQTPKHCQRQSDDGENKHKYSEPAAKRVWRPRGTPWNFANARTEPNLAVNGESEQNSRARTSSNSDNE